MTTLVSLDEARAHLRIDPNECGQSADDAWLVEAIQGVGDAVLLWLKDERRAFVPERDSNGQIVRDSDGEPVPTDQVRYAVKRAVLIELASQFKNREGEGVAHVPSHWGHGYVLSQGATALLVALRRPTIA